MVTEKKSTLVNHQGGGSTKKNCANIIKRFQIKHDFCQIIKDILSMQILSMGHGKNSVFIKGSQKSLIFFEES